jgi:negative modulator of initiation of replication
MKSIEVDDDVYNHIARNTQEIGETASSILRRLLGLAIEPAAEIQGKRDGMKHELLDAMEDPNFLMQSAAVDRFLYFLGVAYKQKRSDFEKVLAIQGRNRTYFATSKSDVEKSGNSTQPKNIPGSPYWVMTNSPTPQKRDMLRDALKLMGYSHDAITAATSTIR